jgi:hypothetical protein
MAESSGDLETGDAGAIYPVKVMIYTQSEHTGDEINRAIRLGEQCATGLRAALLLLPPNPGQLTKPEFF